MSWRRKIKQWKGFLNLDEKEFFTKFRKREWYRILVGEEFIVIPFQEDFKPQHMEELEDEEWEYMGEVITIWKESQERVRLVIFRRR